MPRGRTNYNRAPKERSEKMEASEVLMKVKEGDRPVRIRSGPGVSYSHVGGKCLGKGVFEIVEISNGPGSESGWGRLANGDGWVALDFVEKVN